MISLQRLEDTNFTFAFFHVFAEDLQGFYRSGLVVEQVLAAFTQVVVFVFIGVFAFLSEIGFGDPNLKQLAAFYDLLHGVGGKGLKLDILDLSLAFVAAYVF